MSNEKVFLENCNKGDLDAILANKLILDDIVVHQGCHVACKNGYLPIVQFINRRLMNQGDICGFPFLDVACFYNRVDVVRYLVKEGGSGTYTMLHDAICRGYMDVVEALLPSVDIDDARWMDLLRIAVITRRLDAVKMLVEKGVNPDSSLIVSAMRKSNDIQILKYIADKCKKSPLRWWERVRVFVET